MDATRLYQEQECYRGTPRGLLIPTDALYNSRLDAAGSLLSQVNFASLLDIGCGYGDLVSRLPPEVSYTGIDMTPWIIDEARLHHPTQTFHVLGALDAGRELSGNRYDAVAMLGVLATVDEDEVDLFMSECAALSRRFILVSILDKKSYGGRLRAHDQNRIAAHGTPVAEVSCDTTLTMLLELP